MHFDADLVKVLSVVRPAFAGACTVTLAVGIAVNVIVIEKHHSSESKAEHGTGEDEPEDEVVAFGEANWIVDLAGLGDEGIGWGACRSCHSVGLGLVIAR